MPRREIHAIMKPTLQKNHGSKRHLPHHAPSPATRPACMQIQTWLGLTLNHEKVSPTGKQAQELPFDQGVLGSLGGKVHAQPIERTW